MTAASTVPLKPSIEPLPPKPDKDGVVHLDMEGEVIRLAERMKFPIADLTKEHVTTQYAQLEDGIKQYYRGIDVGHVQGAAQALRECWKNKHIAAAFLVGGVVYPTLKLIVKFIIYVVPHAVHLYFN